MNNKSLPVFKRFYTYDKTIHSQSTRSAEFNKLSVLYFKSNKLQKSIVYQGVKIWNSIPDLYKTMSFEKLKVNYRLFLLQTY